jgi:hypothetical protein
MMRDTIDALALLKGAAVGLAAGLIASLAMNQFQAAVASLSSGEDKGEPSTEKAADRISRAVKGEPLADERKAAAGNLVHYALGAALGVAYGLAAEVRPGITAGFGTAFGAGVAALLDEAAVPAAGLAPPPSDVPAVTHVYALVSHLVFGVTAEASRRVLRAAI